ncbi:MAG: GreA/GreB family elongation factor [candidate division WOR-3 bacterium]
MIEKAKKLIEEKNFSELENLWMEMLDDKSIPIKDFLSIADGLKSIKETSRGFMLLEILACHLINQNDIHGAIEVYKHMPYFTEDDNIIRRTLVDLYKKRYGDNDRIERYIELSRIEKGEHLFRCLERLDEFLKYDIGRVFYFEKYGIGEVVAMNPEKKELVLDFQKQKGYFVKFDVANKLLIPAPEGHYLYRKFKNIEELKIYAKEDPYGLVIYLLKSFKEPLSSSEIKNHLRDVITEDEIDKFWEKVRKKLEKNEHIKIELKKGQKTYHFIEGLNKKEAYIETFKKANIDEKYLLTEKCARENPEIFSEMIDLLITFANENYQKEPALALDILYLCNEYRKSGINYTIDDLLRIKGIKELLLDLKDYDHKIKFLDEVKKREPQDWQKIFQQILTDSDDTKLIEEIEGQLTASGFELRDFYKSVILMPQKFPGIFLYILKKIANGAFKEFTDSKYMSRLINSLEHIKGAKQLFIKSFPLEKFDEIIKTGEINEILKIKDSLIKSSALKDYEKNDYLRIINYHFPQLFEKKEDYIYTTQESLIRKKNELEHLLNVEIPENKKEISRAREYGDLSENFEYKAAKERQDQLYQRLRTLESELQKAKLIDFNNIDISKVGIGTKVILKNLQGDNILEYTILGPWDSDLSKNVISYESPLAKEMLLEKKIGDRINLEDKIYEIIRIEIAKN